MSPSIHIATRETKSGRRYLVRYRLGGRGHRVKHAGSFRTRKDARTRRDLVAGELAAGRDPRVVLERLANPTEPRTLALLAEEWAATRIDVSPNYARNIRSHIKRITPVLGDTRPQQITPLDVNRLVGELARELAPASVKRYVNTLRMILDHAGLDPNPARHRSIKLPRVVAEEVAPPPAEHFLAILDLVPTRLCLPLVVLEQTALRVGELAALVWGDIDEAGARARVQARTAKTRRARWAQIPEWLMGVIAETCPSEDRTSERRVFQGLTDTAIRQAMARACKSAGIPHYHPHDLRHRRLSLWHGQGVPAAELAARAGHSRASMTLDHYSHVMPLEEAPHEALKALAVMPR